MHVNRPRLSVRRVVLVLLLAAVLVLIVFPGARASEAIRGQDPPSTAATRVTLAVLPDAASPGAQLHVRGDGWPASASIALTIRPASTGAATSLGTASADRSGQIDAALQLPSLHTGRYLIDATCAACQPPVAAPRQTFRVLPSQPAVSLRDQVAADRRQYDDLARLKQNSSQPIEVQLRTGGALRFTRFRVMTPATAGTPLAQAQWFLDQYRAALRLDNPADQLQLIRRSRDGRHLLFRQRQNGVPVFAAELAVHLDGATVTGVNGNYLPEIALSATPRLSTEQAEAFAVARAGRGARVVGDTQLRYVNLGLLGFADRTTHLAWSVNVARRGMVLIDANTGSVLYEQARERPIDIDIEEGGGLTSDQLCAIDPDNNITPSAADLDSALANNNAIAVWQWWQKSFFLNSYNGFGAQMEMYLRVGGDPNASYYSGCDVFFFSPGYPVLDIVGHEFTHAVDAGPFGTKLEYVNESGALDESYADIFGWMVEAAQVNFNKNQVDWTIGEDLPSPSRCSDLNGNPYPNGALRDMTDPPRCGQPDHFQGLVPLPAGAVPECDAAKPGYNDCGYVHTNSGIPNKAAYLIINGGTFNGYDMSAGMGGEKAAWLFAMVIVNDHNELVSSSNLQDARNAAVTTAQAFTDAGAHGFIAKDVCIVRNAYAAVGLGEGDFDCDGQGDNADSDSDNDNVPNSAPDNCPLVPNPSQYDQDNDGQGNACDEDLDGDTVSNMTDNCKQAFNPTQADIDLDQTGDACDDNDGDSVLDIDDNCFSVANTNQLNSDTDSVGDACDPDDDNDTIWDDGDGSGVAGDHPCSGGNIFNCDDNSPLDYNPLQEDDDGDGLGDATDLCRGRFAKDNGDPDGDKLGNPCDGDDDNDAICDVGGPLDATVPGVPPSGCIPGPVKPVLPPGQHADNCPLVANPDQTDRDKNGVGLICDANERQAFQEVVHEVLGIRFIQSEPIDFEIPPICLACGALVDQPIEVVVSMELPFTYRAYILDSDGLIVAKSPVGFGKQSMAFQPLLMTGSDVTLPAAQPAAARASIKSDQTRYWLQIVPVRNQIEGRTYDMALDITTRLPFQRYLPVLAR